MTVTLRTPPLDEIVERDLTGDWSPNTIAIFTCVVLDYKDDEHDKYDIIPQIQEVIDKGSSSALGAEFVKRVENAMGFTPDPFSGVCASGI